MDLFERRAAELKAARDLIEKKGGATAEDLVQAGKHMDAADQLKGQIEQARKSSDLAARLAAAGDGDVPADDDAHGFKGSVGANFVASDAFAAFKSAHPTGAGSGTPIRIEAKGVGTVADLIAGTKATITTQTGNPGPIREPGYRNYLPVDEPTTFLNLVTTGSTNVPYSEYAQIVSETDNAAVVLEGNLKPLSDLTTAVQQSKAYTYADGFDVTNQTLADDGALAAFMESRIRRHVLGVIERKLFNGTGAGTEPQGILTTSGTLAQTFTTDLITTVANALQKYEDNNDSDPQAVVLRPADVWALRLLKDAQGRYLSGGPFSEGAVLTLWGVPVVGSRKLAAKKALVGRFDSVHYLELDPINVVAFNQHKDYAQRNMVYVRAEARGRQLFYAPREVVVADIAA